MVSPVLQFVLSRINALAALVGLSLIAAAAFMFRTDVGLLVLGIELIVPVALGVRRGTP